MSLILAGFATGTSVFHAQAPAAEQQLIARARGIHERALVLDTHNDIDPQHFTAACNYTMPLTTQVNLPRMKAGGQDVSFMIAYVPQGPLTDEGYANAYRRASDKFDAVHRLTEQIAPQEIGLALSAADVRRLAGSGRKVAVIGVENGYPIGLDLRRVKEFYDRGARYMSLAHNGHSQLSDSNTGEATNDFPNGGLTPLGRQVIAEMNRLGMMVDVSHPSKASMLQAAQLSAAPIIASHSAVRALANHSRNMDDEMLMALKKNGGVIQIVAFANYIKTEPAATSRPRTAALTALRREFGVTNSPEESPHPCPVEGAAAEDALAATSVPVDRRPDYERRLTALQAEYPASPRATVKDFVDHIDYAVKLIGVNHVGISSDFDGGGGITGWSNASEAFNVTLELVRRGYSEQDIDKIWGGNLLRVWEDVERAATKSRPPSQ